MTIDLLLSIISQLKSLPATCEYFTGKTMFEQVKIMAANYVCGGGESMEDI